MKHAELNGKAVQLIGKKEDLQYLSSQFCFDDFGIYRVKFSMVNPETHEEKEFDEYYLKSSSFDSKANDREIVSEAVDLIDLINGEAQLEVRLFTWINGKTQGPLSLEPVQANSCVAEFEEGRKTAMNHLVDAAEVFLTAPDRRKFLEAQGIKISEDLQKKLEDSKTVECADKQAKVVETRFPLLGLAESDDKVREALAYFGHQHSWANLYRAWDVIKTDKVFNDSGFRNFVDGTMITRGNEEKFKQTANYHRHGGKKKGTLPDTPMDLNEAERFIRVLMLYWVSWKYDISRPS